MNNKLNSEEKATAKPMLANRLLKFRGRKPNSKNWEFFDMNDYFLNDNGSFPLFLEYKMINICQFTGELDEKGNEVYEGDIVLGSSGNIKYLVHYEAGQLRPFMLEYSEVIGNIYENPELLQTTS